MSRAAAVAAALAANETWSPPGQLTPLDKLTTDSLLPKAAYDAANDLAIDPAEADEIATVFLEHIGSAQGLSARQVRTHAMGRDLGFAMFWGYLTAVRESASP